MEELWEPGYQPSGFSPKIALRGNPEYQMRACLSPCPLFLSLGALLTHSSLSKMDTISAFIASGSLPLSPPVGYPMTVTLYCLQLLFISVLTSQSPRLGKVMHFGVSDLPHLQSSSSQSVQWITAIDDLDDFETFDCLFIKQLWIIQRVEHLCTKAQVTEGANMPKFQCLLPTSDLSLMVQSCDLYLWHSLLCVPDCSETYLVLLIFISKAQVWGSGGGASGYTSVVYCVMLSMFSHL